MRKVQIPNAFRTDVCDTIVEARVETEEVRLKKHHHNCVLLGRAAKKVIAVETRNIHKKISKLENEDGENEVCLG